MKQITFLLMLFLVPIFVMAQSSVSKEVAIKYTSKSGVVMEMVFDPGTKRLELRVPISSFGFGNDELYVLKDEVIRLTSKKQSIKLNNDYTFRYDGGYPVWAPYTSGGLQSYECLLFSEDATIVGKEIIAKGTDTPSPYDGYLEWKGPEWYAGEHGQDKYVVQKGDKLWDLCGEKLGDPLVWKEIRDKNPFLKKKGRMYKSGNMTIVKIYPGEEIVGLEKLGITKKPVEPVFPPTIDKPRESSLWWLWLLLLVPVGLFAHRRSLKNPITSGPPMKKNGIMMKEAVNELIGAAARKNGIVITDANRTLFEVLFAAQVKLEGILGTMYGNGDEKTKRYTGETGYIGVVKLPNNLADFVIMAQWCGNDLRLSGIPAFFPGDNFRFKIIKVLKWVKYTIPVQIMTPDAVKVQKRLDMTSIKIGDFTDVEISGNEEVAFDVRVEKTNPGNELVVRGFQPEVVWKRFTQVSHIYRASGKEGQLAEFVVQQAVKHGMSVQKDVDGNVLVKVPASPGCENRPSVCLQSHLDMVCEPDEVVKKEGIQFRKKYGWLTATGTSLGGDNGVGVACMLAVMDDPSLFYGPLELLFTVQEEVGLIGVMDVRFKLESKRLINLDSEDEGVLYNGCAASQDTIGKWSDVFEDAPEGYVSYLIRLEGLKGGHSGLEIQGRENAVVLLARLIQKIFGIEVRLRVASFAGGTKRNVIPGSAEAVISVPAEQAPDLLNTYGRCVNSMMDQIREAEPSAAFDMIQAVSPDRVLREEVRRSIINAVCSMPNGVVQMHADVPNFVETSSNIGVLNIKENNASILILSRSCVNEKLKELAATVRFILQTSGATVEQPAGYPGWNPNPKSALLQLMTDTYEQVFGKIPEIKAIHAGLECGVLVTRFGMDAVSIGPTIKAVHSVDERIEITTVEKHWDFLVAVLNNL